MTKVYTEEEIESIEEYIMDQIDDTLKHMANKIDLVALLIDSLESRKTEIKGGDFDD